LIEAVRLGHFPRLTRKELEDMLQIRAFRQTKVYQEAHAEGRTEGREEIAGRLLAWGLPVSAVAELTGLAVSRVRPLKKQAAPGN